MNWLVFFSNCYLSQTWWNKKWVLLIIVSCIGFYITECYEVVSKRLHNIIHKTNYDIKRFILKCNLHYITYIKSYDSSRHYLYLHLMWENVWAKGSRHWSLMVQYPQTLFVYTLFTFVYNHVCFLELLNWTAELARIKEGRKTTLITELKTLR